MRHPPLATEDPRDIVATFDVMAGNGSGVADIIDASPDGRQLVHTDAENEQIGFVDISDPTAPTGAGTVQLDGRYVAVVIENEQGLAVAADGEVYAATDNDGVHDVAGDTVFLRLGDWQEALAG